MGSCTLVVSIVLLLMASLFTSPSSGVTHETLATICSQTQNEETCQNLLESDPRTASANLPQLSLISIELTMKQANNNYQTFSKLRDNATDPALKDSFNKCVGLYQEMLDKIKVAYQKSQDKQYKSINELAQLTTLTYKCANRLPSISQTDAINEDMILTSETSTSVNAYIASSVP